MNGTLSPEKKEKNRVKMDVNGHEHFQPKKYIYLSRSFSVHLHYESKYIFMTLSRVLRILTEFLRLVIIHEGFL